MKDVKNITEVLVYGSDAYLFQNIPKKVIIANPENIEFIFNSLIKDNQKICIRGAGTGYTGGSVPLDDEVVIKLSKFDNILQIDIENRYVDVESGVTPFSIKDTVRRYGLFYPPDPASFKICTIGGNIATNAGGPHCYMYGVTSNYVQKIKVLIPKYKKSLKIGSDSPYSLDYDLKDLFIGSEGLLGIITEARLKLLLKPPCIYTYLIRFDKYLDAIKFIYDSLDEGLIFAALDMSIDPYIPDENTIKDLGAYLLISLHGGDNYINHSKILLNRLIKKYCCEYQSSEGEKLMDYRSMLVRQKVQEVINTTKKTQYFLFDAVVPRSKLEDILIFSYKLANELKVPLMNTFHAGDGNIHPTVFYDPYLQEDLRKIKLFWYALLKMVLRLGGSITGEHGIGLEKSGIFSYYEDENIIKIHKAIKSFFDPNLTLNPNKVLIEKNDLLKENIRKLEKSITEYVKFFDQNLNHDHSVLRDGIAEVFAKESFSNIIIDINKNRACLPYYPVAFEDSPILFLVKNNIPNLYPQFTLMDIILGMELESEDGTLTIGRRVLKNVAGFSLKLLSFFNVVGNPKKFFLKVFPSLFEKQYITISFSTNSVEKIDKIYELLKDKIINLIVYKLHKNYRVNVVLHNHSTYIDFSKEILKNIGVEYNLEIGLSISLKDEMRPLEGVMIVGLKDMTNVGIIEKVLKGRNYIVINNKTIVIPVKENESVWLSRYIVNSFLKPKIESIRYVNKSKGNKFLFLSRNIQTQINITKKLVEYIRNYVKGRFCTHEDDVSLPESISFTALPPIKLLSIPKKLNKRIRKNIKRCTRCGLCLVECPQYQKEKDEKFSPRGLIMNLISGKISKRYIEKFLSYCINNCNLNKPPCEELCPTGVSLSEILITLEEVRKNDRQYRAS